MAETFILIPGRTSRQGVGISEGKYGKNYQEETQRLRMNSRDMDRLGLSERGRVRLRNETGEVEVEITAAIADELPEGMLFIAYGDLSSRLMAGDTHGSGMPTSKGLDVQLEVVQTAMEQQDGLE